MKTNLMRTTFLATALLTALAACHKGEEPTVVWNGQPSQVAIQAGPTQAGTVKDPSLPDAATVIGALDAEEKARDAAIAAQQPVAPAQDAQAAASQPVAPSGATGTKVN